jgi:hypothetical protein
MPTIFSIFNHAIIQMLYTKIIWKVDYERLYVLNLRQSESESKAKLQNYQIIY